MTTTITLTKSLVSHSGNINTLSFKEPTAREFVNLGEPFKVRVLPDGTTDIDYNNKVTIGFLSMMTGLDEITLEGLSARDFSSARQTMLSVILGIAGSDPTEA
jgi:hypothetical protein